MTCIFFYAFHFTFSLDTATHSSFCRKMIAISCENVVCSQSLNQLYHITYKSILWNRNEKSLMSLLRTYAYLLRKRKMKMKNKKKMKQKERPYRIRLTYRYMYLWYWIQIITYTCHNFATKQQYEQTSFTYIVKVYLIFLHWDFRNFRVQSEMCVFVQLQYCCSARKAMTTKSSSKLLQELKPEDERK